MARRRAVVTIQPPGLGGRPVSGHFCTATTKASWTASSASSMSPRRRTSVATARPYSSRNTPAMAEASKGGCVMSAARVLLASGAVLERAHLDRAAAGFRRLRRPRQRRIQVGRLDDPESAELLLGLGEGAIGGEYLAVAHPHHGRDAGRLQAAGEDPGPRLAERGVDRLDVVVHLLHDLLRRGGLAIDVVHGQQVLLHGCLPCRAERLRCRSLTLSTNAAAANRQRGDSRCRLCLAALAQEFPELADRLVLVRSEILRDDQPRAGPVGAGVLAAFFQHEQRMMRDLDVILHIRPRDAL